jgi:DNA replication and repair protein RecF
VDRLREGVRHWLADFSWGGSCELVLAGGSVESSNLLETLERSWPQDVRRGYTTKGPHTADILVRAESQPVARLLSRGQQKIVTMALLFAQCELMRQVGRSPVLLLDDLGAELDEEAFGKVARSLVDLGLQAWITTTQTGVVEILAPDRVFHVEHGRVISA